MEPQAFVFFTISRKSPLVVLCSGGLSKMIGFMPKKDRCEQQRLEIIQATQKIDMPEVTAPQSLGHAKVIPIDDFRPLDRLEGEVFDRHRLSRFRLQGPC
jgi:hypothetical protein